jgi:CRISPR-associated endonuclease/helicase Cas3
MLGFPTSWWGKLAKDESGEVSSWHPLADHCADVAATCEALLGISSFRSRLARLGDLDDLSRHQVARLAFLAVLHDLGKLNHGFQRKAHAQPRRVAGHVAEAISLLFGRRGYAVASRAHAAISPLGLERWGKNPETGYRLLSAAIAHHGRPIGLAATGTPLVPEDWTPSGGRDPIEGLGFLVRQGREWFPDAFADEGALPDAPAFQHGFSGLITLADWIGSDRGNFTFSETGDSPRIGFARARAAHAVRALCLDPSDCRAALGGTTPGFEDLFPGYQPRAAQSVLLDLPAERGPTVTLLEAETGAGKTEAALSHYFRLFHAGQVDAVYFALPTRTAATQIHARVTKVVRQAFPEPARPPVTLAVPGYLRVDNQDGTRLSGFEVLWNDDEKARWRFRGWAAENAKRYLAGAIVVGTVDQVLLSALQVNHSHMRAVALLRHLLVVDEVHASDRYMSRLLRDVLQRHWRAGGHALLMSATLGSSSAASLVQLEGEATAPPLCHALIQPYPAVTHSTEGHTSLYAVPPSDRSKQVQWTTNPWMEDPDRIAAAALDAAAAGARVVVLRNTVKGCLEAQGALERQAESRSSGQLLFVCRGVVAPHHSRFAADDRKALDEALEGWLGGPPAKKRGGGVVVATQTIQQSLDLDADYLITDLCPMDVLLQRMGRLHRHARERADDFRVARCEVLTPAVRDLEQFIDSTGAARGPAGIGLVYPDLRMLDATWTLISERSVLRIPADNRELVERTTHPEALDAAAARGGPKYRQHNVHLGGVGIAHGQQASLNLVNWNAPFGDECFPTGDLAAHAKTRLGEGDRLVRFDRAEIGPFGQPVSELTVPHWLTRDIPEDLQPTRLESSAGAIRFQLDVRTFRYDRWGLRPDAVAR